MLVGARGNAGNQSAIKFIRGLVSARFETMLVGAGGNAGNQSVIKLMRGLVSARFEIINDAGWSKRQRWQPECD
jgi:Mg/Co/Ni transporter MgtE